jgi:flagellar biosynthetic protein FlhB
VGLLVWWILEEDPANMYSLMMVDLMDGHVIVFREMLRMAAAAAGALTILAILDLFFQRHDYEKQLMMTRQEVKDERKQTEGDPHVKGHIRAKQRDISLRRMMESVKTADAVVTNPVHYAVALKYEPAKMAAPKVVAKGARLMAKRIREIAEKSGVPIVEDPPLARALYKACEVGSAVPISLYKAVAELLAFVYRKRDAAAAARGGVR